MARCERSDLFYDCLAEARIEAYDRELIQSVTWDFIKNVSIHSRDNGKYPALSKDSIGRVSYARSPEDKDNDDRRIMLTLNKFLRRQCGDISEELTSGVVPEHEVEKVCDIFRRIVVNLTTSPEEFFKIISAEEIPELLASIKEPAGVEMGSCMTGDPNLADAYRIFQKAEGVKLECLLFDDGSGKNPHGKARAFLWTFPSGMVLMDRIYNNSGYHLQHFREYAETHGIWQRQDNSLPDDEVAFKRDGKRDSGFTFKLPFPDCMPYMDSFSWATETGRGVLMQLHRDDADLIFQSTSGGWDRCGCRCVACEDTFDPEDTYAVGCERYCTSCYHDTFIDCERCGEREDIESAAEVDGAAWCVHCTDRHATECDRCGEMRPSDAIESWDAGGICSSCRN
tara:strand:- start:167 stop:1357 length:1191 start_codon:yes stop_codon:yes gene_type:complete